MDEKRPKPIYATSRNTESVRKGYEMGGYLKNRDEIEEWDAAHKVKTCPAHPVNVAESSSPMPGLSPKQEQEDFRILLGRLQDHLSYQETQMQRMRLKLDKIESMLAQIIEALAEDQDPDEMPARYMDGKLV